MPIKKIKLTSMWKLFAIILSNSLELSLNSVLYSSTLSWKYKMRVENYVCINAFKLTWERYFKTIVFKMDFFLLPNVKKVHKSISYSARCLCDSFLNLDHSTKHIVWDLFSTWYLLTSFFFWVLLTVSLLLLLFSH